MFLKKTFQVVNGQKSSTSKACLKAFSGKQILVKSFSLSSRSLIYSLFTSHHLAAALGLDWNN
jgi:hypothetical protein